ncbi:MAG: methyltransferase [Bacteroidota bacterium]
MKPAFRFKQFSIDDSGCAMKIGTDAVLLGAMAAANAPARILDVGTGCGIVALMLAQRFPSAIIDTIEIDNFASEKAQQNFIASPWKDNLSVSNISLQKFLTSATSHYDLIVSNPPYFNRSLRNPDKAKTIARHDDELPLEDLLHGASILLKRGAPLWIILPRENVQKAILTALSQKLFLNQQTDIMAVGGKNAKRSILAFTKEESRECIPKELHIKETNGNYSSDFTNLCKEYYLGF